MAVIHENDVVLVGEQFIVLWKILYEYYSLVCCVVVVVVSSDLQFS